MGIRILDFSIKQFVQKLRTEEGFSFARYGDGTFMSLNGMEGVNCDGAQTTIKQAAALEASILDKNIFHGIGDLAVPEGKADEWVQRKGIHIDWYDGNVMNTASHQGRLYPFIEWVREQRVVLIGPPHLPRMKGFPVQEFIEVHPTHAFDQLPELTGKVYAAIEENLATAVLISAGPAAPPLVSRTHQNFPGINAIDVGSIWDPYVGVLSRKIHRTMGREKIAELGKLNFKQETNSWWTT